MIKRALRPFRSHEGDANKGRATTDRSGASGRDKPHRNGAAQTEGKSDDRFRSMQARGEVRD